MSRAACPCGAISGGRRFPPFERHPRRLSHAGPDPAAIGLEARRVAWRVLQAVAAGAYTDLALERELRRSPLAPADRGLATELACGAIRQRALLDGWIDALGKVRAERQPPPLRWLLHLGLYQLLFTARVPPSAAVSTTVELAKRDGLARLAPVVNGLLRACLRRRESLPQGAAPWEPLPLPADPAASLALRGSLPHWLATGLLEWLPERWGRGLCPGGPTGRPPLDLRVNRLRATREGVIEALAAAGVSAEPLPGLPWASASAVAAAICAPCPATPRVTGACRTAPPRQMAALLDPQPGERLLDACTTPGGKSTRLAELIGDAGTVLAVDRSEGRLRRLRENASRLGLSAIEPLTADAAIPGAIGGPPFNRILLDAPCSGLGTLARHPRWPLARRPRGHHRADGPAAHPAGGDAAAAGPRRPAGVCHLHGAPQGERCLDCRLPGATPGLAPAVAAAALAGPEGRGWVLCGGVAGAA